MKISWEREIISPIHDDDGKIINADDNAALRARIRELEERLGIKDGKPLAAEAADLRSRTTAFADRGANPLQHRAGHQEQRAQGSKLERRNTYR